MKEIKEKEFKMALLPVILNMVDDMYEDMNRGSHCYQKRSFPMLFVPSHHPRAKNSKSLQKSPQNPEEFKTEINVQSFKPEEISVKVKGREILIEGKHEEREDVHGFISRQFRRRYTLPEEFDADTVTTYLDENGKMTVKAQKPAIKGPTERVIPIERIESSTKVEETKKQEAEYKLEDVAE